MKKRYKRFFIDLTNEYCRAVGFADTSVVGVLEVPCKLALHLAHKVAGKTAHHLQTSLLT